MTSLNIQQSTQSSETVTSALIEKLYNLAINSTVEDENNSLEMSLTGSIYSISAYESSVLYLREKFPNLTITIRDNNFYIRFADSEVERVLINSDISTDHTGVSKSDVNRLVILPNNLFKNNTTIQSFNELQQFLSVQIGNSCFEGCTNLNQINLSKATTIGNNAFNECSALSISVNCPNLTSIGTRAFKNCSNLQNITNLGLVNIIQDGAFSGCTLLETATLPSNTSIIKGYVFNSCLNLTTVSGLTQVTELGGSAFIGCSSLTSIGLTTLNVQKVEGHIFEGCSQLTGELNFPNATELHIGDYGGQFAGCSKLTKLTFGHIDRVGYGSPWSNSRGSFRNCSSLKYVDLGDSFQKMCAWAFRGCTNLKAIVFRSTTPPTLSNWNYTTDYSSYDTGFAGDELTFDAWFGNPTVNIYVPDSAVNTYKESLGFDMSPENILPLSQFNETAIMNS